MSTGVITWSQAGGLNASSDSAINFAEGQAPSTVNDSARNLMASVAKWRDDITGILVTGGTGAAYAISSNQGIATNIDNFTVQFTPGISNTGAVTLSVDSQMAKPLRFLTGVDLPAGVLISGSLYQATYRAASQEWLLHSFAAGLIYSVPIGGMIDYFGTTAPNSSFVFPYGQPISRTVYATLFGLLGTTFGVGDGLTTFNLPDLRGRVVAGVDNMGGSAANRITNSGSGIVGTTLGATGGAQNQTLLTANLPPYTPAGSVASSVNNFLNQWLITDGVSMSNLTSGSAPRLQSQGTPTITSTFTGAAQGGTSSPVTTVPPTIVCNKLLRIV